MTHDPMLMVYIASPYSNGDAAKCVRAQMDAAHALIAFGCCPVAPLMSHFQHLVHPRPYEDWMRIDFELLRRCDVVLRLKSDTPSSGADREVEYAMSLNIPIVTELYEVMDIVANRKCAPKRFNDRGEQGE